MAGQRVLVIDDSPTIHKVVGNSLKKLGLEVSYASEGKTGVTTARELNPHIILLDFMMPDMNGYQVCKALGEDEKLENTPVILMSAKGEMLGEKLVKTMGIVDFITKPFSPEAVSTVVQHAIDKFVPGERAGEEAVGTLMQVGERKPEDLPTHRDLSDPRGQVAMSGNLGMVPVPEIFQLLKFLAHTGILHMACGDAHLEVFVREGTVIFAKAINVDDEFLLGRSLIAVDAITTQDLEMFLENRKGTSRLLGEQLVKLGHVTQEQLNRALARQTEELMYEAIRWGEGEFAFYVTENLPIETREANLHLSIDQILMDGLRRIDEWGMIEKEIRDFNMVLAPSRDSTGVIKQIELRPNEEIILNLVDGRRTIKEIIRSSRRSSFYVCKILYRLLSSRIVRKRSVIIPPGEAVS